MGDTPVGDDQGVGTAAMLRGRHQRELRRGANLYHEDDPAGEAYFVHAGLVKLVKTAADGSQVLVAFRGPGGFVGEHSVIDCRPRLTSAVAVVDTTVTPVARDRLVAVIGEHPDYGLAMLSSFAAHVRALTTHLLDLRRADPVALVAGRLLQLVADPMFGSIRSVTSESVSVEMPVSQHDLAAWAGVSHRSVGSALRRFRNEGLITTSRLHLEVHDASGLAAWAGA